MSGRWVSRQALLLLHADSLAEHGGAPGLRDEGLLDSALARPQNLALHAEPDAAALAATYALGLAKNHAFIDGDKRAAFLAAGLFLGLNGWRPKVSQAEATLTVMALASGDIDEAAFAAWLRSHIRSRT